ncbi:amidase family protein [Alkalihalobacillus sp. MEB130]|uniref:amidase family protein n=1 Tax=Alkalihalobacillus sp. MEB130 TaxID=2976704 RepID=UPI0028DE24AF|nr:amidase family protein [Alkalihalobacillus sp. MEB130]MDT8861198.1 amidase family protein [Alkalihalobacillus sp. MEB130]
MSFHYKHYDAIGLAQLIKEKEIKREEVIETAIQEIEKKNPKLNAVIHRMYERALKEDFTESHKVFSGVPILTKNILQEIKGEPITNGSRLLNQTISTFDSEFIKQIKETGVSILGQTNVPEFALMGITEPEFYGPSKNPWNTEYSPGGSSGGSAAAVAAGMVPIAGANDGGGSIRIPASFCGLFGLKPTRGRTPIGPTRGRVWQGASVDHILSRTVRDSAAMLDQYRFDRANAFFAPPMKGSYIEKIKTPLRKPLHIAYTTSSPIYTSVHPECIKAVEKTVSILESEGHHVVEKEAPVNGMKIASSYMMMYFAEMGAALTTIEEKIGRKIKIKDVESTTWLLGLLGKTISAEDFVLSMNEWDKAAYQMELFHDEFDLYLTPTTANPPSKIGELEPTAFEKMLIRSVGSIGLGGLLKKSGFVDKLAINSLQRTPFTQLANITGQPAISVPLHLTDHELPCGVQFIARRGCEDILLQLAAFFEKTNHWIDVKQNPMY